MRHKKLNTFFVIFFTVWFLVAATMLVIAFSIQNTSIAIIGGMLIGGWFVNFIRVASGGYFYDRN